MKQKTRYTLKKQERLTSRKSIEQLFANGKSFSLFPFKVIYLKSAVDLQQQVGTNPLLQTAFSTGKKYFKKAHDRNRIKRLMREAYRLQKNSLQENIEHNKNNLSVFIIYVGNELPEYKTVYEKMNAVINRLLKIAHESQ